jgi:hypothetical protein
MVAFSEWPILGLLAFRYPTATWDIALDGKVECCPVCGRLAVRDDLL